MSNNSSMQKYTDLANRPNLLSNNLKSNYEEKKQRFSEQSKASFQAAKGGFLIGAICGAGLGFFLGTYQWFVTKQFMVFPVSIIASGLTFGFIMGTGALVRSEELIKEN